MSCTGRLLGKHCQHQPSLPSRTGVPVPIHPALSQGQGTPQPQPGLQSRGAGGCGSVWEGSSSCEHNPRTAGADTVCVNSCLEPMVAATPQSRQCTLAAGIAIACGRSYRLSSSSRPSPGFAACSARFIDGLVLASPLTQHGSEMQTPVPWSGGCWQVKHRCHGK